MHHSSARAGARPGRPQAPATTRRRRTQRRPAVARSAVCCSRPANPARRFPEEARCPARPGSPQAAIACKTVSGEATVTVMAIRPERRRPQPTRSAARRPASRRLPAPRRSGPPQLGPDLPDPLGHLVNRAHLVEHQPDEGPTPQCPPCRAPRRQPMPDHAGHGTPCRGRAGSGEEGLTLNGSYSLRSHVELVRVRSVALTSVQPGHPCHLVVGQLEVEDVEVLLDPAGPWSTWGR